MPAGMTDEAATLAEPPGAEAFAATLLPRHGQRPLCFQGRLLMSAVVAEPGLPVASAIALHEVLGGGFVAAVRHEMRAPLRAEPRCYAAQAAAADGVLGFLHAHDPLRDLPADSLLEAAGGFGMAPAWQHGDGAEDGAGPAAPTEAELLAAAALLAPRLRAAWHGLLAACFGPPAAGGAEPPDAEACAAAHGDHAAAPGGPVARCEDTRAQDGREEDGAPRRDASCEGEPR